jgi:hypothetical protein
MRWTRIFYRTVGNLTAVNDDAPFTGFREQMNPPGNIAVTVPRTISEYVITY